MVIAESNFRNGGANLRVCLDSAQESPSFRKLILAITLNRQSSIANRKCRFDTHGINDLAKEWERANGKKGNGITTGNHRTDPSSSGTGVLACAFQPPEGNCHRTSVQQRGRFSESTGFHPAVAPQNRTTAHRFRSSQVIEYKHPSCPIVLDRAGSWAGEFGSRSAATWNLEFGIDLALAPTNAVRAEDLFDPNARLVEIEWEPT